MTGLRPLGEMAIDIDAHQKKIAAFLAELNTAIKSHKGMRRRDAWLYQFLVIGAAIAGFASLAFGMMLPDQHHDYAKWPASSGR